MLCTFMLQSRSKGTRPDLKLGHDLRPVIPSRTKEDEKNLNGQGSDLTVPHQSKKNLKNPHAIDVKGLTEYYKYSCFQ